MNKILSLLAFACLFAISSFLQGAQATNSIPQPTQPSLVDKPLTLEQELAAKNTLIEKQQKMLTELEDKSARRLAWANTTYCATGMIASAFVGIQFVTTQPGYPNAACACWALSAYCLKEAIQYGTLASKPIQAREQSTTNTLQPVTLLPLLTPLKDS